MKKVIEMYFDEPIYPMMEKDPKKYRTGLILVLEDGTKLAQNSTDAIESFTEID